MIGDIFSPLERGTPDTSDHSQDEFQKSDVQTDMNEEQQEQQGKTKEGEVKEYKQDKQDQLEQDQRGKHKQDKEHKEYKEHKENQQMEDQQGDDQQMEGVNQQQHERGEAETDYVDDNVDVDNENQGSYLRQDRVKSSKHYQTIDQQGAIHKDQNKKVSQTLTLQQLLQNEDISTRELVEKSNLSFKNLILTCQDYLVNDNWKWRLLCYLSCFNILENQDCEQIQTMLQLKKQNIPAVKRYRTSMPKYLENGWTYEELDILHKLTFTDLTLTSLEKFIPNHPPKEIIDIMSYLRYRIPWTLSEMKFVKLYKKDEPLAMKNLPLRTKLAVERQYYRYFSNRNDEDDDIEFDLSNINNTDDLKLLKFQKFLKPDIQPKSKSPIIRKSHNKEKQNARQQESDTINLNDFEVNTEDHNELDKDDMTYCIQTDLTLETLRLIFPNHSLEDIVTQIRKQVDTETIPLTKGEKLSMKTYLKQQTPVESILHQYPCRSEEFVKIKYREFEFNANRKTKFKNQTEKLVYEAQWSAYLSVGGASGRTSRRVSAKPKVDLDQVLKEATQIAKPQVVEITEEEKLRRQKRREFLHQRHLENIARRKALHREKMRVYEERKALGLVKNRPKSEISTSLKAVLEGSTHFQSVIGDRKIVEEGQKRKRVQADHYKPEFVKRTKLHKPKLIARAREQEKLKLKQAKKLESTGKKRRGRPPKTTEKFEPFKVDTSQNTRVTLDEEEEDDDDEISPFDPTNICTDTLVPLNGRKLFLDEFYEEDISIPNLTFEDSVDHTIMMGADSKILVNDNIAAHIITSYKKNYRSLPVSFPPLFSNRDEINTKNLVKVRFLVYPQHCELYVLAQPKSNELDPIYEIVKLFMIHYSLYFSHSEEIKDIIMQYCETLEASVEQNCFSDFMFVIDKWNMLMLELSPNVKDVAKIKEESLDINKEIREEYLSLSEVKIPTLNDLELELFYSAVSQEESSPAFNTLISGKTEPNEQNEEVKVRQIKEPTNISEDLKYIKPDDYNLSFFNRLKQKSDISRFAIHQILLRIYSRIVSTDSRKLRSYKAFTAEVYGELLPSFTSEVLEKVNLLPHQKFYDLGSGVGNTTFQAALEFGAKVSGGCEIMEHASKLCKLQEHLMRKHLAVLGLKGLNLDFALLQSFVDNQAVRANVLESDVLIINNYLFDANLNNEVGRLLYGLKTGTKIISLRNFIRPRYKANGDSIFDRLSVEKHEMSDFLSVSWTANKVPYYISTVEENILPEYLNREHSPDGYPSGLLTPVVKGEPEQLLEKSELLTSVGSDDTVGVPTPSESIQDSMDFDALNAHFSETLFPILEQNT